MQLNDVHMKSFYAYWRNISGCPPSEEDCPFEVCDDADSCSKVNIY